MKINWKTTFALVLVFVSKLIAANPVDGTLMPCHLDGIKAQVKCGTLQVPENYQQPDGSKLKINFAVIRAIDNSQKAAPLMFLAGGPGQAAVELAAGLRRVFSEVRKHHDLILIDQRGTGRSHPLQCDEAVELDAYQLLPEDLTRDEVNKCINELTGDLSQFTSENAIRDFDAVRKALGYSQVNLYGGSYGTRAALVYMRLFPESIRSVVLDSVGPIEVPIGLFGKSAARSFQKLVDNCLADTSCQKAYPSLVEEFAAVSKRLEDKVVTVDIMHPRLGTKTTLKINKNKLLGTIRIQLYSTNSRNLVPLVIHQAYLGNYAPLAGLIAQGETSNPMYLGLTFNIICNEDFPKVTAQMFKEDADNTFEQDNSHLPFKTACSVWPKYRPNASFYQAVTADIPTLILSGDLDPVTPPSNGELTDKSLPNSHHIVVQHAAHTVAMSTCAADIVAEFIKSAKPDGLDESCLDEIPPESFMTSLNDSI